MTASLELRADSSYALNSPVTADNFDPPQAPYQGPVAFAGQPSERTFNTPNVVTGTIAFP